NSVIVRTNIYGFHKPIGNSLFEWAYGNIKNGNNINGFNDVFFNPVYTKQLAIGIQKISPTDFSGVINIGCEENISKYELLIKFAKVFNIDNRLIKPVSVDNGILEAKRPKNTTLDLKKMKKVLGISFSLDSGVNELYLDYSSLIGG
ncbi:MAG: sugar nucleotide-binding protein, partial [Bacillota bacterium]|nr:sugar nucleotide-binding protein [Bacillota bacterium]